MFSERELQFAVLAFSSLFSVINPISAAPIFVGLTGGMPAGERRRAALRACVAPPATAKALGAAIAVNILLTIAILLAAPAIVSRIGATGQRIVSKIMGLITTVIGIQFVLNGVSTVLMEIIRAARS